VPTDKTGEGRTPRKEEKKKGQERSYTDQHLPDNYRPRKRVGERKGKGREEREKKISRPKMKWGRKSTQRKKNRT